MLYSTVVKVAVINSVYGNSSSLAVLHEKQDAMQTLKGLIKEETGAVEEERVGLITTQ